MEFLEVNCPPLPQLYPNKAALSHGQTQTQLKNITKTSNGSALHSYAEYECPDGYAMRGKSPPYFICGYPNGSKWVPDLAEKNFYCQAPGCYASDVLHGNFSHQWVPANDSNEINCDAGFTHDGINQIKCIYENGNYTWDHQGPYRCLPSCQGNPCGPNGRCQISQDNDTYTCDCDKGYRMTVNGSNRTCEDINECTDHIDLCDSITSTCQNTIGSYLCICNSGTEMYENVTMNTYNFPNNKSLIFDRSCIRTRCPIPQFTEYMVTTNDLFLNNSSVTYYCPKALQSLTMTCQASVWSKPDENFCTTTISCPKPNVTISTILTPNNTIYSVYDTISYSCEPGYTLIGPNETICLETGWNSNAPICTMQKCEDISKLLQDITYLNVAVSTPPSPTHESWIKGTKLHFSCENGHVLNGSSTMYCSDATDGTLRWSENTLPTCE
uniref:Uncharacterized protein n=1 Tax=Acrobeloides nanus TaxID=290746 RepID=A0A914EN68_9BILA